MSDLNFKHMDTKKVFFIFLIALVSAITGVFFYSKIFQPEPKVVTVPSQVPQIGQFASMDSGQAKGNLPDLTIAAEQSVHAVVHVMTKQRGSDQYSANPLYEFFFGPNGYQSQAPVMGSGSGVIITTDGYIVTNNHVVAGADEIEVALNDRRTFSATLVGADPTSDIALLKVDAMELPYIRYGNSDDLKVGEWVLAVGNPFNLTSTVTAGIVSAKARSINIIANGRQPLGIESFIQTDAAVNPGNSGGALVNQRGELVGINTAIASRTGSFSGYSFAVPVGIAKKVVSDLMEFGEVQRGLLGVNIAEVTEVLAKELGVKLDRLEGVFVVNVTPNGGAMEAGVQSNDIIVSVDGELVNSVPELQEKISRHRPGDKVNLMIKRGGKTKPFTIILRNVRGTTSIISTGDFEGTLGATLEPVSQSEKQRLRIRYGIKVSKVGTGKLQAAGVKDGFVITKANRVSIDSVDDFKEVVGRVEEGLFLTGIYPNGRVVYYAVNLQD